MRYPRIALIWIAVFLLISSSAAAHVTVRPRQSQMGATERYTVLVPTEGQVATVSVELEVPPGVIVTEVVPGDGYTFDVRRADGRIVAITWKREISPKEAAQFTFVARNPQAAEVAWKARQRFADGTSADWVGVQGGRRPAAVTRLASGQ